MILDETKAYLKGQQRTHTTPLPDSNNIEVTHVTLNSINPAATIPSLKTSFLINPLIGATITMNLKFNPKSPSKKLRFMLQGKDTETQVVEFVYNSQHGVLLNQHFHDFDLKNVSKLTLTIFNDTVYLGHRGVRFADIVLSQVLNSTTNETLGLIFDLGYSDGVEVSELQLVPGPLTFRLRKGL